METTGRTWSRKSELRVLRVSSLKLGLSRAEIWEHGLVNIKYIYILSGTQNRQSVYKIFECETRMTILIPGLVSPEEIRFYMIIKLCRVVPQWPLVQWYTGETDTNYQWGFLLCDHHELYTSDLNTYRYMNFTHIEKTDNFIMNNTKSSVPHAGSVDDISKCILCMYMISEK